MKNQGPDKDECERQGQILFDAILAAIDSCYEQFESSSLNAILAALIAAESDFLNSVEDGPDRQMMIVSMEAYRQDTRRGKPPPGIISSPNIDKKKLN